MKLHHKILLISVIIAFFARFLICYYWRDTFDKRGNALYVINIALNLANGKGFCINEGTPSIDHEPLYPLFLAAGYKIFGYNWFGQYFFQIILSILTGFLIYLIGKQLLNIWVGVIAGIYSMFYPYLFTQSLSVIDTTLFIFLLVLSIYLLQSAVSKKEIKWALLIGFVLALCLLTRSSVLVFFPFILIFPFFHCKKSTAFKLLGGMLIMFALTVAPWLIRNTELVGQPIIATHGGYGLWQGNNEYTWQFLSKDISLDVIHRLDDPPEVCQDYSPHAVHYKSPQQSLEAYYAYRNAAIEYIKQHPKQFISLMGLKFIKFWSWIYNPVRESYRTLNLKIRSIAYTISYLPILIFGLIGVVLTINKWRKFFLFFSLVISYTIAHMIVMGYTRVRLPLDPFLMIFAARGFLYIKDLFIHKRREIK